MTVIRNIAAMLLALLAFDAFSSPRDFRGATESLDFCRPEEATEWNDRLGLSEPGLWYRLSWLQKLHVPQAIKCDETAKTPLHWDEIPVAVTEKLFAPYWSQWGTLSKRTQTLMSDYFAWRFIHEEPKALSFAERRLEEIEKAGEKAGKKDRCLVQALDYLVSGAGDSPKTPDSLATCLPSKGFVSSLVFAKLGDAHLNDEDSSRTLSFYKKAIAAYPGNDLSPAIWFRYAIAASFSEVDQRELIKAAHAALENTSTSLSAGHRTTLTQLVCPRLQRLSETDLVKLFKGVFRSGAMPAMSTWAMSCEGSLPWKVWQLSETRSFKKAPLKLSDKSDLMGLSLSDAIKRADVPRMREVFVQMKKFTPSRQTPHIQFWNQMEQLADQGVAARKLQIASDAYKTFFEWTEADARHAEVALEKTSHRRDSLRTDRIRPDSMEVTEVLDLSAGLLPPPLRSLPLQTLRGAPEDFQAGFRNSFRKAYAKNRG